MRAAMRRCTRRATVLESVWPRTGPRPLTERKAPAVAEVRHGPAGVAQAKLLQSTLPKGTVLFADKRKGATVDVALGAKYTGLAPAATASGLPTCPAPSAS